MALEIMAQSIRDAIAPVFLLTGVASVLNVMTTRLGRIVDRYRRLEELTPPLSADNITELSILYRRSHVCHWAIGTCTFSALLICLVIGLMFVGTDFGFSPEHSISLLFITSMASLVIGLVLFLEEVRMAMGTLVPFGKNRRKGSPKRSKDAG